MIGESEADWARPERKVLVTGKVDPFGKDQHEPGAKLDAGKYRPDLLTDFSHALKAMAQVATYGAEKYTEGGWITVPNGTTRYRAAFWRHLLEDGNDPETGMPHEWHALWNLMALIELKARSRSE